MSLVRPFREACGPASGVTDEGTHLLGTSGTVTTLAGIHLDLKRYQRNRVDGLWLGRETLTALLDRVRTMTPADRAAQPCIGPDRVDLVIPGCAILDAVMNLWPAPRLRVADRGLREGMLQALMRSADRDRRRRRRRRSPQATPIAACAGG